MVTVLKLVSLSLLCNFNVKKLHFLLSVLSNTDETANTWFVPKVSVLIFLCLNW